ncbi:MAG: homoserine O-acetyltransferase [Flaviflexus sp.]|nr:homoserine O-acetyltransferase [Flaviflexus sp.]
MSAQPHEDIPVTGAYREGEAARGRSFADLGKLDLDDGRQLPVTLAYETFGRLTPARDNAVLILHALTGDSHCADGSGEAGWWREVVGPGKAIDTDRYFVLAPNVLGGCQGSTGPASAAPDGRAWGSRFGQVTARDQVRAEALLADRLGIDTFELVVGASMGGHRALEWAITHPGRVRRLALIATGARTTADQIGLAHTQLLAIESDPDFSGGDYYDQPRGPWRGLALARRIAHLSYRTSTELDTRFGRLAQDGEEPLEGGRFAVQSYLDHHGEKLARRFDANSYAVLTRAMLTHDVGRGRGGLARALGQITARTMVIAVDSDRLFGAEESRLMSRLIPGSMPLATITSAYGHDAFLIEHAQVSRHLATLLTARPGPAHLSLCRRKNRAQDRDKGSEKEARPQCAGRPVRANQTTCRRAG